MKRHLIPTVGLAMLGAFAILATPARGGIILLGGQEGTSDPPTPTQGAETEEDWNPVVTCSIGEGQGLFELLTCLEDEISNPPPACPPEVISSPTPAGGIRELEFNSDPEPCVVYPHDRHDFNVWILVPPPDRWGIEIRRLDGSEIQRLSLRENDPGIQTTELQIDAPGRVALIRLFDDQPTGQGSLILSVNDSRVTVPTSLFPTALEVNAEIVRMLRHGPFDVAVGYEFLQIRAKKGQGDGIRRVQVRSTDAGLIRSDLSLLPDGDEHLQGDLEAIPR